MLIIKWNKNKKYFQYFKCFMIALMIYSTFDFYCILCTSFLSNIEKKAISERIITVINKSKFFSKNYFHAFYCNFFETILIWGGKKKKNTDV